MEKRKKIAYWIFTAWLALGMVSTGIAQIIHLPQDLDKMAHLGYPAYLLTILGVWKILGAMVVLLPKFTLIKEWAYAGFFFAMSGAVISHIVSGSPATELFGSMLLLALTIASWALRPANRRVALQLAA